MPRRLSVLLSILFLAGTSQAANPVDVHGRLRVQGNRIVGETSGDTVQLTGMSFFWHNWMGQLYTAKTVDWLVDDFHCSVVRAAVGADFSDGGIASATDIAKGRALAGTVTDQATKRGIYTIIDWHSHHAPKHIGDAVAFFDTMATKYGNNPGVIFEIFNEPWSNDYTWSEIKAYSDSVTKVIRRHSPNLVLVGTRQWSRDVDEASLDPVADTNSAYVLHFYAGSHRDTLTQRGRTALANGVPLFVSEWGTTNEDGGSVDKAVYTGPSDDWFRWIDSNKISSCNWSVQNKEEASAILKSTVSKVYGWDTADLTTSGKYVRDLIRARNTQYTFDGPPIDSSLLPGRIQAENFTTKSSELTTSTNEGSDGAYLGYSAKASWAQWSVTMPAARKVSMWLQVATDRTTGLVVKINGAQVKTKSFGTTGGWGTWGTIQTDSFSVPAGPVTVRIEWTDVFDLDWFEFHGRADGDTGTVEPPDPPDSTDSARVQAEHFTTKSTELMISTNSGSDSAYLGQSAVGSWAQYSVNLPEKRQVAMSLRVATDRTTGLVIKVNGTQVRTKSFPTTGGWGTWATVTTDSFTVPAGASVVRIEWTDVFDLDWFTLSGRPDTSTEPPPPPRGDSLRVYAASYTTLGGATGMRITGSGDDAYLSWSENGNWAEFNMGSSHAQNAVFEFRYATPQDTAKIKLSINGGAARTIPLPKTGNWGDNATAWKTTTTDSVAIPDGSFRVRVTWVGQFDLNYLEMRGALDMTPALPRKVVAGFACRQVAGAIRFDVESAGHLQILDAQGHLLADRGLEAGSWAYPVSRRGRVFVRWIDARGARTIPLVLF